MADNVKTMANKRLHQREAMKGELNELKDNMVSMSREQQEMQAKLDSYVKEFADRQKRVMKKVRVKGRRGGGGQWDVWVVTFVCELLVIGVPPSAIPKSIVSMYWTLYGKGPDDRPSENFCRQCRTVVEAIGLFLTAIKLGKFKSWDQTFFDATTRRGKSFLALVLGCMENDDAEELDNTIVSSCIFLPDETAETSKDKILEKVCE